MLHSLVDWSLVTPHRQFSFGPLPREVLREAEALACLKPGVSLQLFDNRFEFKNHVFFPSFSKEFHSWPFGFSII